MIQLSNIGIQSKIVDFVAKNKISSTGDIEKYLQTVTRPTLSRYVRELKDNEILESIGEGRGSKYTVSQSGIKMYPFDVSVYEQSFEAQYRIPYNRNLFTNVSRKKFFSQEEKEVLNVVNTQYIEWSKNTEPEYKKIAFERCAIEFSWKSSKIEGNTYTLLETENLIKNKREAQGKSHDEAVMILNQKHVFDLIYLYSVFKTVSSATLIDMHKLIIKDLGIPSGLRRAQVGITGTQYTPLTLPTLIEEALGDLFSFIANTTSPVEKAIIALAGIAYIQPFADGNKRVSRHFANFILHSYGLPPVAWRTVNEIEYKKAMIAFYELGNIEPIKVMWITHYVETANTFFSVQA